jgi:asparagine synthase (glutamine-hydrolysing)
VCGIAAIFAYRPSPAGGDLTASLRAACARMACRGPDAEGTWASDDRRVLLGNRRLAIIDLSERGAQPMVRADTGNAITYNGEIYNYRALRKDLERRGVRFTSDSDTEVLLRLYEAFGADMARRLRGMFAFAIWDANRQGVFFARDTFGIKPLYIADDGTTFRAASEVKALVAGRGVDTAASAAGHVGFFLWGSVPEPFTLFRGIRSLPPGTTLWVGRDGPAAPAAFESTHALIADAEDAATSADAPERVLRDELLDSVRAHVVSDVPVGLYLSGGLDSATLASLATEVLGSLATVTLAFEEFKGTRDDEAMRAEATAARLGTGHSEIVITRDAFRRELDQLIDRMDQPTIDGVNSYFVARAAAHAGLKVVLSGLGGDELFGGYPTFHQVPRLARIVGAVPAARWLGRHLRPLAAVLPRLGASSKYAAMLELGGTVSDTYFLRRCLFLPWELDAVLDRDLVHAGLAELALHDRLVATIDGVDTPRMQVAALEAAWYMRNQLLRDTDWASMSHSLEVRVPMVDATLWRAVLPFVARGALAKANLASVFRPPLPDDVARVPKTGFNVPVRRWIQSELEPQYRGAGYKGWAKFVYDRALAGDH